MPFQSLNQQCRLRPEEEIQRNAAQNINMTEHTAISATDVMTAPHKTILTTD